MLIAQMYGHTKEEVYDIAAACEVIHNGSLMIDDIEDSSTLRRNKQCVHLLYGIDIAINAANFMYFAPLSYLIKSCHFSQPQISRIATIYSTEMTSL
jgi:geranylgeranyl pyrophosphate synthase